MWQMGEGGIYVSDDVVDDVLDGNHGTNGIIKNGDI
jgi:hypothetical protein